MFFLSYIASSEESVLVVLHVFSSGGGKVAFQCSHTTNLVTIWRQYVLMNDLPFMVI